MTNTTATLTVTDLAEALETDPRTTRKFLRAITPKEEQPGKGSRWAIDKKKVTGMKKQFKSYAEALAAKAEAPAED